MWGEAAADEAAAGAEKAAVDAGAGVSAGATAACRRQSPVRRMAFREVYKSVQRRTYHTDSAMSG